MDAQWEFTGEIWYWRGPSPFHFVTVPADVCAEIADEAAAVSYGWGMIPVAVQLGASRWPTSLWPKEGRYVVPVKTTVRRADGIVEGDVVTLTMGLRRR